jgi:FkbM family methyltransferase
MGVEMKNVNGIWLPDDDTHFAEALMKAELFDGKASYQLQKLNMALGLLSSDRRHTAIDIGGHVGLWSRVLSWHFDDVLAFEPIPKLADCFDLNVSDCDNVRLERVALGRDIGTMNMQYSSGNSGNSCVSLEGIPVPMFMLDAICQTVHKIDFIKIDVEGYELNVLLGAEQTIYENRPMIVIEQKPGNAERYGLGRFDALEYLKSQFGMRERWHKAGDYCLTF